MKNWLPIAALLLVGCSSRDESAAPRTGAPAAKPAAEQPAAEQPAAAAIAADAAAPAQPAALAAEAPSLPGARLITSAASREFGLGPGSVYWCDDGVLRAAPKDGGAARGGMGPCQSAHSLVADADGIYQCSDRGLVRLARGSETVMAPSSCLGPVVDDTHVYYVVPGFPDVPDPGVYRVAKAGGDPEKLFARTPREQYMLAVDSDALWIGTFGGGAVWKLAKAGGGKATKVVSGQKHLVDLAVDADSIYWLAEDAAEVRRRKKSGGAIAVIGRDVWQEPLVVQQGHAYWIEGAEGQPKRLVHLAPGAGEPAPIASDLESPWLLVDAEGVYLSQLGKPGIFAFPPPAGGP